jgi:hypothetical protein
LSDIVLSSCGARLHSPSSFIKPSLCDGAWTSDKTTGHRTFVALLHQTRRSNAALALPEVAERLVPAGASEPYITTLDGFNAIIRRDYETYGQGVTVD